MTECCIAGKSVRLYSYSAPEEKLPLLHNLKIRWADGKGKALPHTHYVHPTLSEETAKIDLVTKNLDDAMKGVELIVVCTQALSHHRYNLTSNTRTRTKDFIPLVRFPRTHLLSQSRNTTCAVHKAE